LQSATSGITPAKVVRNSTDGRVFTSPLRGCSDFYTGRVVGNTLLNFHKPTEREFSPRVGDSVGGGLLRVMIVGRGGPPSSREPCTTPRYSGEVYRQADLIQEGSFSVQKGARRREAGGPRRFGGVWSRTSSHPGSTCPRTPVRRSQGITQGRKGTSQIKYRKFCQVF